MKLDDDQTSAGGLDNQPDTATSYEDIADGGAGGVSHRNAGGDRLIDWVAEFEPIWCRLALRLRHR